MKTLSIILALALFAAIGVAIWVRQIPMPPDTWHRDPQSVAEPDAPMFALRRGDEAAVIAAPMAEVARRLDAAARADRGRLIAGDLAEGFATYVVRSRVWGFPDAVSIRLETGDEATRVAIFSRSAIGGYDWGANAARVERWLAAAGADDAGAP